MKRKILHLILLSMASCHSHGREDGQDREPAEGRAEADERPALSFTHWTETSEVFIELRALVRGRGSRCAAHVTRLQDFAPLSQGRVTVILRGASGEERFESPASTSPGIFRPVVKPTSAGKRRLSVEIRAQGLSADHDLGEVMVFENVAAARTAIPESPEVPGRIVFLKEQQWAIEFGTSVVSERPIRPSLRATGSTRARSDGEIVVTAPVAGRVATSGRAFPRLGERVTVDDLLGVLAPRLEAADLASLELAVTSADLELRFADRERQRLEGLRTEGAVPERRVQDALHAVEEAQASLGTAQRRLDQFRRVQRTAGRGEGTVQLRAPLSGTVTEVHAAPGAFVEAGAPLFRVTDLTQLWLEARIPEADVGQLGTARGASFLPEGLDEAIELPPEALLARGSHIDPLTQTLALLFAVDNASGRLPVGAFGRAFVMIDDERSALAVPEPSLVDDGGVFVVFVQVEGEAFERRIVRVGARDRGYVELLSGVRAGEHVVTRGAWSVKLAASSGSIPAHGHSH
jgi:cobalt-zinc-cadmium efflux system membrane fusion protein